MTKFTGNVVAFGDVATFTLVNVIVVFPFWVDGMVLPFSFVIGVTSVVTVYSVIVTNDATLYTVLLFLLLLMFTMVGYPFVILVTLAPAIFFSFFLFCRLDQPAGQDTVCRQKKFSVVSDTSWQMDAPPSHDIY